MKWALMVRACDFLTRWGMHPASCQYLQCIVRLALATITLSHAISNSPCAVIHEDDKCMVFALLGGCSYPLAVCCAATHMSCTKRKQWGKRMPRVRVCTVNGVEEMGELGNRVTSVEELYT